MEQEEEYLVNTLQKRMGKLHLEKTELEKALEKLDRKVDFAEQRPLLPLYRSAEVRHADNWLMSCIYVEEAALPSRSWVAQPLDCLDVTSRLCSDIEVVHGQCEELRLEQCKMSREKEVIENQLEAEQEYIVNKLQKQAMGLATEKQALQLEKADLKRQVWHCQCRCA